MPYPGRQNIYESVIRRMVKESMEAQESEFARIRGTDTDEQLLVHLRLRAEQLGHMPWPGEMVGGSLIESRFGTWESALEKAGLHLPVTPNKLTAFGRYQEEVKRQQLIYREKKAAKRQCGSARKR